MAELNTNGFNAELARLRRKGLVLPTNPNRAVSKMRAMQQSVNTRPRRVTASEKLNAIKKIGGVQMSLEKTRQPLDRFTQSNIPYRVEDIEERTKIRDLCRIYYATHNLVPTCIDIYSRFPLQGMKIVSKDPELTRFYEELFFDQLDYEQFLIEASQEFFTIGEVNMLATFNETLGIWENEQIINPDDLTVTQSPFSKEMRYHMKVPESIKQIIETREPRADYEILVREYPEVVKAARESTLSVADSALGEGLEISDVLLSRMVNKSAPWDLYGTPQMMRVFTLLNLEEGLYAAQKAVADRLYSPLILAKLGSPDLGDGEAWVPDEDALEAFTDQMNQAMAADFRFLTYHFGVEIESVFGREAVPRFDQDFDRIESKILEVWGIGESLITGAQGGPYASSALNMELITQMMSSYQKMVQRHFRKRAEVIAEAQGHFDYNSSGGVKSTIMEEYLEVDDDGNERVRKRPKLLVPELQFASMNLRDEETQRTFLMSLKQAGVPISDKALMVNMDMEFDDEVESIRQEKVKKIIAEAETLQQAIKALQERQLPLPPELLTLVAQQQTPPPGPPMVSQPVMNDIAAPINTPNIAPDPNAATMAQNNLAMLPVMPGGTQNSNPGPAPAAPAGPPQVDHSGPTVLPQNWISSRPEISDNMRGSMPKAARAFMRHDPSVVGKRALLTEESIQEVTEERPWTRVLGSLRRRDNDE